MSPTIAVPHATHSRSAASIGVEDLLAARIGALAPRLHHAADPGHELRGRRHLVAQIRQLEMRVRVDEAGHHRDITEIDRPPPPCATRLRARRSAPLPTVDERASRSIGAPLIGRIQAAAISRSAGIHALREEADRQIRH